MIMLKTLSKDVSLVCDISDNLKFTTESAASRPVPKAHHEKGIKFPARTTTPQIPKSFCKDINNLHNQDEGFNFMFPTLFNHINSAIAGKADDFPILGQQRALLQLAKSRAVVEAASVQNNLFQAGFQDCASEVIRFLREQENLDNGNPLVRGLQTHLDKMSNTVCGETIADLDLGDQCYSSPQTIFTNTKTSTSCGNRNRGDSNFESELPLLKNTRPDSVLQFSNPHTNSSLSSSQKNSQDNTTHSHPDEPSRKRKFPSTSMHKCELVKNISNSNEVHNPSKKIHLGVESDGPTLRLEQSTSVSSVLSSPSSFLSLPSTLLSSPSPASSILELRANLLPGMDSNSLASGNFADVLLAVESCQSHNDPRVRKLANAIIHLVHDGDDGDFDDEEYEEGMNGKGDDTAANRNVVAAAEGVDSEIDDIVASHTRGSTTVLNDSGIDLGEDWCNPADIIEC